MDFDGFDGVDRTAWRKTATSTQPWAKKITIKPNGGNQQCFYHCVARFKRVSTSRRQEGVDFEAHRFFQRGERDGFDLGIKPEHQIVSWKIVAAMSEGFTYDSLNGIACDRPCREALGNDEAQASTGGIGQNLAWCCYNKQRPSSDTLALEGVGVFRGAVQARRLR